MGRVRRQWVNRGAGFTLGPSWLGHRSPVAGPARDAGTGTAHCPLKGPAGNSGTTDDRSPNAGTIPINPPAQRRMGVKRRLVDQGTRTYPCVSTVLLLHDTGYLRHRYREMRPVADLDARLPMHGAKNLNPVITLKNLLRRTYCPQAGGRCSVTGRLCPFRTGMVKPARQPAFGGRNPDPRPDGCLRDQRSRRHRPARLPHVESAWRPRVPGVGGRSRGNPRPAPGGADIECLHAMRTLRASGGTPR